MENLKKKEADDLSLFDGSLRYPSTLSVMNYNDILMPYGTISNRRWHFSRKMAESSFEDFVYIITPSTITLSCRMNVYIVCHIQRQILITQKHIM